MTPSLTLLAVLVAAPAPDVSTEFVQLAAAVPDCKTRAVVLIHGLCPHPIRPAQATRAWFRPWQDPRGELVRALARDSDVFAFAYAQTAAVEDIARCPGLGDAVARLRRAGYAEVVLIGHSAGGLVARQFVENFPDAGVTKVLALAAPFCGFGAAALGVGYRKVQAPFVESMTPAYRAAAARANRPPFPADVEFACVVCRLKPFDSDGLVPITSQWSCDLQAIGIPAVPAPVNHLEVVRDADTAKVIACLVREKLARWSPDEVAQARKALCGKK